MILASVGFFKSAIMGFHNRFPGGLFASVLCLWRNRQRVGEVLVCLSPSGLSRAASDRVCGHSQRMMDGH